MGRGPARQQPTRDYRARLIANIFVLTGDIGGRGRDRSAWGRASGCRAPREVGRGGEGEDKSEGWSGEIRESDATSDEETE